ncbi:MAG: polysaccharide pyruvyl transferase family protein [Fastidiosipilaceae bacterium]|jgi:colanic acid/amylovoran biosynthesis protein
MVRILMTGATCSKNRGSTAMLVGAKKALQQFFPGAQFTLLSIFPGLDTKNCKDYEFTVIDNSVNVLSSFVRFSRSLVWRVTHIDKLLEERVLKEYANADVVIDLSGDGFTDDYGLSASINSCYTIILCKLINKPIVIYAQSIGPFKTLLTKWLSKYCLNRVDLLIVRDEITQKYLKEIGVTNTIHFTADAAFLLEPAPTERVKEIFRQEGINNDQRPLVGISASQHIYDLEIKTSKKESGIDYISKMVQIVDHLVSSMDAQIVFVPHVTHDAKRIDDRYVAKLIYEQSIHKNRISLINTEYSAGELKGIIGQCDLFIGPRMHANIAATSMGVPTLAIAYSHKTYGIMDMLGMGNYVLNFQEIEVDEMKYKLDELWRNRVEIRSILNEKVGVLQERALYNGLLVKQLLGSRAAMNGNSDKIGCEYN